MNASLSCRTVNRFLMWAKPTLSRPKCQPVGFPDGFSSSYRYSPGNRLGLFHTSGRPIHKSAEWT